MFERINRALRAARAAPAAAVVLAAVVAQDAQALGVDIFGSPGSGNVTFTFSGSSTNSAAFGTGLRAVEPSIDGYGEGLGDFYSIDTIVDTVTATSSTASATVGSTTLDIVGVGLADFDMLSVTDDGFNVVMASALPIGAGETVSWSGSLVIPRDISLFNVGTYSSNSYSEGGFPIALDLSVRLDSDPSVIPGPPALAGQLGVIGALSLFWWRRRRRAGV